MSILQEDVYLLLGIGKPHSHSYIYRSSGGCLSLQLLLVLRDMGYVQPSGALLISPFVDHECNSESWLCNSSSDYLQLDRNGILWAMTAYAGSLPLNDRYVSPIYHSDLSNLAPILIQAGNAGMKL